MSNGGPAHNPIAYVIEDWSGCGMYGFEEEPNALEHFRRHLEGEAPLAPYNGSRRRPRVWKKAISSLH